MFTTPSKRRPGGASKIFGSAEKYRKIPLNGFLDEGVWKCNCTPRLPAQHFQVKKEGRNKGRWFYTCQEPQERSCKFFLWDTEAAVREKKTVIGNSRSESDESGDGNGRGRAKVSDKRRSGRGEVVVDPSEAETEDESEAEEGEDEFGDWELSVEDEKKLVQAADGQAADSRLPDNPSHTLEAQQTLKSLQETPRKVRKESVFATPGSKRKRDEDTLPTPATTGMTSNGRVRDMLSGPREEDIFNTPPSRLKGVWDGNERFSIRSPEDTPTSNRYRNAKIELANPDTLGSTSQNRYDISEEVMGILRDQGIDEVASTNLRNLLNKHAMKISGIAKGRDITRLALKGKDARIAELQQRITTLEGEREMDKRMIRNLKRP